MEREAFRQRMQQYKQARESNPQLKYWDWKKENDLGYQLYKNNLPSNLQVETDDYDLYGAYESNMQPELNEDGTYHLGSRDPYTGRILKSKQHPTYQKAIESEISAGYFPYEKNNVTYTKTYSPVDISGYADGGEVKDNTYVAPVYKEQVFIPATGALKIKNDYQYKYGSKSPYKGGELEIVSPEFDILTGVRGLKSTINNLLDNYIGRKLPSNYAYRRTVQQELDDIISTNSFREIPENVVTTGGRTITLANGKTVTLKKAKGNSHGGKAFSAGDVWKGTTSSGNSSSEIIVGIPGDNAKWMVGKHGNYQGPYNFSDIEKGSGIFVPFDAKGVANISTEGLKSFKPSKYFNNRYIKYVDGGIIDEDPPQNTSERPITNFDPKGDPSEIDYPTTRHELGHYIDFNLAKSSNPDYSNSMFAELKRDLSKQKNPLFPDKTDYYSKGTEQKSYMNTLREYMLKTGMINNIGDKVTSRQIKKAIRSLPKDMRSIEAAYLQFATPGQYTKWFNKIPLLGTYPIVNEQFQNYEEDKDKAGE